MLSALDLDIIKLTAQSVARNGDAFRAGLAQREVRNPLFDFMKLGHPAFHFFQTLVQSYTACLLPPREALDKLKITTNGEVLERVLKDVEWRRYQESTSEAALEREKKEREARAVIDWHKFVIVETIDFDDEEEMPAPQELGKGEEEEEEKPDVVDHAAELDEGPINVRKDYKPSLPGSMARRQLAKCPVCGQEMPVDELDEHMRMELMDRNNMQNNRKQEAAKSALAPALDIHRHLAALKDHRTDIFGDEAELAIGKSASNADANRPAASGWDGHNATAQMATAQALRADPTPAPVPAGGSLLTKRSAPEQPTVPQKQQQQPSQQQQFMGQPPGMPSQFGGPGMPGFQPQQQQHQQHQQQQQQQFNPTGGLPPPQFGGHGGLPPQQQPSAAPATFVPGSMKGQPLPGQGPPPDEQPPPAKKTKLGDWTEQLTPEGEFAAQHSGEITVSVVVPVHPNKAQWKMNGQTVSVPLPVTATVAELKQKLQEAISVPVNKQKLKVEDLPVLRDNFTLAYYNIGPSTEVQFGVKERGRKRK